MELARLWARMEDWRRYSSLVRQSLRHYTFFEGNNQVSTMKLSLEEKKSVFKLEAKTSSEMVYTNLIE